VPVCFLGRERKKEEIEFAEEEGKSSDLI